jgi:putative membrane protein
MTKRTTLVGAMVLAFALGTQAQAGQGAPTTPPPGTQNDRQFPSGGQNPSDRQGNRDPLAQPSTSTAQSVTEQFAVKAAQDALAEMRLGQLAQQKGSSSDVRDFGKKMVEDHGNAHTKIKQLAERQNITLTSELTPEHQSSYERLSGLSGAMFDRAYVEQMVNDHQQAVAEYQREAEIGSEAWKDFAESSLPMLREHLESARMLSSSSSTTPTQTRPTPGVNNPTAPGAPGQGRDPYGTPPFPGTPPAPRNPTQPPSPY